MTIHKSKGLEWNYVFLLGCNDIIFPNLKNKQGEDDDRRLFYVACTRAAK